MKILLVEDNLMVAEAFTAALVTLGYEVDHASNSSTAVSMIIANRYNLAIIDLVLVASSGVTVVEAASRKGMKIIVMSASPKDIIDSIMTMLKIKGYTVDASLKKSILPKDLVETVQYVMKGQIKETK